MCVLGLTGLLLYGCLQAGLPAIINQTCTVGSDTLLFCNHDESVIWSKGVDGGRRDILTAKHGEEQEKPNHDPDNRYSALSDLSLRINNVSLSDSGIYYCNAVPVINLTVTPAQDKKLDGDDAADIDDGKDKKIDGDDTDDDDDGKEMWWKVSVGVGVSSVALLLLFLVLWGIVCSKSKGGLDASQQHTHVYDSIHSLPKASRSGDQPRDSEPVYFLLNNPVSNPQADQERQEEAVYFGVT